MAIEPKPEGHVFIDPLVGRRDPDWEEEDDYEEDQEEYAREIDPCSRCGPSCPDWGGDGLCMLQIRQIGGEQEDYSQRYTVANAPCPVCGTKLTLFKVPGELWTWPGDFYSPMVALSVYGPIDVPKAVLHGADTRALPGITHDIYHVWIGDSTRQQLIAVNCDAEGIDPNQDGSEGE